MNLLLSVLLLVCWAGAVAPGVEALAATGDGVPAQAVVDAAPIEHAGDDVPTRAAKPQPSFGLSGIKALQRPLAGYPLWQYLASFIWITLAFVAAALVDYLVASKLARLGSGRGVELSRKVVTVARWPLKAGVLLILLNLGVRVFNWPEWIENILTGAFVVLTAVIVTFLGIRLVDVLLSRILLRVVDADAQLVKLVVPVLGKTIKVFLVIMAALTTAQCLGMPVTSILAGLGIGGVAVALAAQNTLANLFGTLSILVDRPFRVGDRIKIDAYDGTVENIGLRSTRLRTLEGHLVTIPNKNMSEASITNISLRPAIRQLMTISLTYDTTPERMREAVAMLREIFHAHPLTQDAWVYWRDYGAHSLDIFVIYWCKSTDYKKFLEAMEEINLEIKRRFDAAKLDFAFPTQTIHVQPPTSA